MTSPSDELQKAIYDALVADAGVAALVDGRIYDEMPSTGRYPCVTFGPSYYRPDDADCVSGRVETFQIDCWSQDKGRLNKCRVLADAVKYALHEVEVELSESALVEIRVVLVRVFKDQDDVTAHGVVQVEADIEEA